MKKIQASSIAEIVIALAVIAICFGIASLVFVRSTNVGSKFSDVQKQTELQSDLFKKMMLYQTDQLETVNQELELRERYDEYNDSLKVLDFISMDNRVVWTIQQFKK